MKTIGLVLGLCLVAGVCFADVTAEVIGKEIDTNGNIIVKTQYKIDGVEVPSRYPMLNGKYYYVTRYSVNNFYGMDKAQVEAKIDVDIKAYADTMITKPFYDSVRQAVKDANSDMYNSGVLADIVGHTAVEKEAEMLVDTDFDGVPDKKWTVKTTGEKVEEDYTPPITP